MSYQVLARKWRPKTFHEMVGQEHVLKALINALDHDRLHHAYLFTGTRGVGKTTIARVLAKCLNCETGISSTPCNQCSACIEINEGRFVDLIEVDAASRTKVEDTRELLENVQYAPSRGRFKVYIIDEVHMLSNSSFNALLKTLEEPPPHVKFLLATTDPQKLPVTILSRCLQFNLKNMSPERIVGYLQQVLEKEMVPFEESALWQLGRAADGSMRDALSLTDQAIAYGAGKISDVDVRAMLGTLDQHLVTNVLQGLVDENPASILQAVAGLAEHAPDYSAALGEIISVLHRIAIAQVLPEAVDNSQGDRQQIYDFAGAMAAEDVQLYYQTAVMGRRDLPLIPDSRGGFEMIMLRMLAFKPQGLADIPKKPLLVASSVEPQRQAAAAAIEPEASDPVKKPKLATVSVAEEALPGSVESEIAPPAAQIPEPAAPEPNLAPEPDLAPEVGLEPEPEIAPVQKPERTVVEEARMQLLDAAMEDSTPASEPPIEAQAAPKPAVAPQGQKSPRIKVDLASISGDTWPALCLQMGIEGLLQSTIHSLSFTSREASKLVFCLDEGQSALYDSSHQQRLAELLSGVVNTPIEVEIKIGESAGQTPAALAAQRARQRQQAAEASIMNDPVVQQLQDTFGAEVLKDSIKPID